MWRGREEGKGDRGERRKGDEEREKRGKERKEKGREGREERGEGKKRDGRKRKRRQKKRSGEQGGLVFLGAASPYALLFHQAPTFVCRSLTVHLAYLDTLRPQRDTRETLQGL